MKFNEKPTRKVNILFVGTHVLIRFNGKPIEFSEAAANALVQDMPEVFAIYEPIDFQI